MRRIFQSPISIAAAALLAAFTPDAVRADGNDNAELCAEIADDHAEAIRQCTLAIESGDLSAEDLSMAYANRAYEMTVTGDYDSAIRDARRAAEINEANALAYTNLGYALSSRGDMVEAISAYEDALVSHELHGSRDATVGFGVVLTSHLSLAKIYDHVGRIEESRRHAILLQKKSGADPRFQDVYDRHGLN